MDLRGYRRFTEKDPTGIEDLSEGFLCCGGQERPSEKSSSQRWLQRRDDGGADGLAGVRSTVPTQSTVYLSSCARHRLRRATDLSTRPGASL
ncbi:hypothetical protein LUU34_01274700 [Aix galericulata]|nr:hypothetical protein LUU34_01274700 [Aix galericulata]